MLNHKLFKLSVPLAAALSLGVCANLALANSHDPEIVKWTPQSWGAEMRAMPEGDPVAGERLHVNAFCASCHGSAGESMTHNWPNLAGQRAEYTYKQLIDYQDGRRHEDERAMLMITIVQGLDRQDMADLAAFYAAQDLPGNDEVDKGHPAHSLVSVGDPQRLITPCAACHGVAGSGGINESPAIRGNPEDYFIRTMKAYRDGRRDNDVAKGMSQFAKHLTDEEIEALANYYAY